MQPLVRLNPLTYGVDLMRQTLLHSERHLLAPAQFAAWLDVAYLGAFALVCLALAAAFFGREEHLAPMMLGGAARRLPLLKGSPRWRSSSTATTTR
jgi:hypothetical protein